MVRNEITAFILGSLFGAAIAVAIAWIRQRQIKSLADALLSQSEAQKVQYLESLIHRANESFASLSIDALSKNSAQFLDLAHETLSQQTQLGEKQLDEKKKLIDQTLVMMKEQLERAQRAIIQLEKDREQKFGQLAHQLNATALQLDKLSDTTNQLRNALSATRARGQWGERMAEDILRLIGFVEGVNYEKQKSIKTSGSRPDYTFLLPNGLTINMDVKFPFDNYLRYLESESETDKSAFKSQFLRDVRLRIKEATTRDYINPEENTLDYVIVFIPNEDVYRFINATDATLLDFALSNKAILCSPSTLYAILAIIRQSVDNFNLEKRTAEILALFGSFYKQWDLFVKSFDKVGKKIEELQNEYETLQSTRVKQLERPLKQINDLKRDKDLLEL
jgi:DNA recombination protein RmuC